MRRRARAPPTAAGAARDDDDVGADGADSAVAPAKAPRRARSRSGARAPARAPPAPRSAAGSVDSRDATLHYLTSAYLLRGGSADAVAAEVRARDQADATNAAIVAALAGGEGVADTGRAHDAACLRAAVTGVEAHCGRYSDYGLKHVRTLNNLCNAGFSGAQIEEAAEAACA